MQWESQKQVRKTEKYSEIEKQQSKLTNSLWLQLCIQTKLPQERGEAEVSTLRTEEVVGARGKIVLN